MHLSNEQLVYGSTADGHRLLVALSIGDAAVEVPAPGAREVVAGSADLVRPGGPDTAVRLGSHGWAVLEG